MGSKLNFEKIRITELVERGIIAPEEVPEITTSVKPKYGGPKVLVVDDETLIADTLAAILNTNGYRAVSAYNADSALAAIQSNAPDMLITDVVMPGMSGVELALRVHTDWPDCRIVLFSGQAGTTNLMRMVEDAGQHFPLFTKPVHPSTLLREIGGMFAGDQGSLPRVRPQKATPPEMGGVAEGSR